MIDPITGRDLSTMCWNGLHREKVYFVFIGEEDWIGCEDASCGCLCHPRNQVEPVPVVPGFEDPCTYCLGLKEVPANCATIPCPKCCSAVSSEKEKV